MSDPINRAANERVHLLKCWQPYFDDIESGRKPFELRQNDRDYRVGDVLELREFNPSERIYSGRVLRRTVQYVLIGPRFGLEEGYAILGLAREPRERRDAHWFIGCAQRMEEVAVYLRSRGDRDRFDLDAACDIDRGAKALREVAATPDETRGGWQPIETAPKDGTRVLLWLSDEGFAVTAAWRVPPAYPDEDPCWWSMEMDLDVDQFHEPTHWMPVPRLAPTTPGEPR